MKQIPKKRILRRIEYFKKQDHPEFEELWAGVFIYNDTGELERFSKEPFFSLEEVLSNKSELYLSHNGYVRISLSFEKILDYFNIDPSQSIFRAGHRICATKWGEHSFFENHFSISESNPAMTRFYEKFFELPMNTFTCNIVEAGYGLRIDSQGQLGNFLRMIKDKKIPLLINTFDLEQRTSHKPQEKIGYVVNGIEI